MEAFGQWLNARSNLKRASSEFLDACITLQSAAFLDQTTLSGIGISTLELILSETRLHIDQTTSVESELHNSHALFSRLFNETTLHRPIAKLPSEILSQIFSTAVASSACFSVHKDRYALSDISRVCAKWRQVAIDTRTLWSHIDVRTRSTAQLRAPMFKHMRLLLFRSKGVKIHLHIDSLDGRGQHDMTSEFMSIMRAHYPLLGALEICEQNIEPWARAVFQQYSNPFTPSPLKVLEMKTTQMSGRLTLPGSLFKELVVLNLSGLAHGLAVVDITKLAETLSNTPSLHTLCLESVWIDGLDEMNCSIVLPCLRVLHFNNVMRLERLIPLIYPGALDLDLRLVNVSDSIAFYHKLLQLLFERSNVVSMTCHVKRNQDIQLKALLSSIPQLRSLIVVLESTIGDGHLVIRELEALVVPTAHEPGLQTPHLRSLCLVSSYTTSDDLDRLKRIVAATKLRLIGLLSLKILSHQREEHLYGPRNTQITPDLIEWLRQRVEKVVVENVYVEQVYQETADVVQQFRMV